MIDTIRLKIPIRDIKEEKLLKISYEKAGNLYYKLFKDQISVGSYSYELNIYINKNDELYLEFSVPKYIHGNNLEQVYIDSLYDILKSIYKDISTFCTPSPVDMWIVMRLDICSYIESENPYSDITIYQMLDYPRQKKYLYDSSVMFVGSSYSTKFYIKEEEFFKHDFLKIVKYDSNLAYNLLQKSKGKIRVETTYRSRALKSVLKTNKLHVQYLINHFDMLKDHSEMIWKKLLQDINPKKLDQKNLLDELQKKFKPARALQLYQFYIFYYSDEFNKMLIKKMYSRSQIYRNEKIITDILRLDNLEKKV